MPGQYTFPRAARLTRKSEYAHVFERGARVVGRHFICYMVRHNEQGCKLGFAVSRKVGRAVTRNRIKRYLREFFRNHREAMTPGTHLVVVARPAAKELTGSGACADAMRELLRQGGVWRG